MTDVDATAILSGRDVRLDIEPGDLVSDIIVLTKVVKADGEAVIIFGTEDHVDWIMQRGMISAAQYLLDAPDVETYRDDA